MKLQMGKGAINMQDPRASHIKNLVLGLGQVGADMWKTFLPHNSFHYYNNDNSAKVNDGTKFLNYLQCSNLITPQGVTKLTYRIGSGNF